MGYPEFNLRGPQQLVAMDIESNDLVYAAQEVSFWEYFQLSIDALLKLLVENKTWVALAVLTLFLIRSHRAHSA